MFKILSPQGGLPNWCRQNRVPLSKLWGGLTPGCNVSLLCPAPLGICMPSEHSHFHRGEIEETVIESVGNEHSTLDGYSRRTTLSSKLYHTKGKAT